MASGQTTNLGLPQIIGTDLVNSNDINNGFYKIDEHAGVVDAKITKLETESGGSSEELENVNNTISEVRDDITTIESSVKTNTQDIVLLKRHQNESDARIDALEGASGSGGGLEIKVLTININNTMLLQSIGNDDGSSLQPVKTDINSIINGNLSGLQSQGYDNKTVIGVMPNPLQTVYGHEFIPMLGINSIGDWYLFGYGNPGDQIKPMNNQLKLMVLVS